MTYACFEIHCKPIRNIHFLVSLRELGLKVDGSQVLDFDHFEDIVNGHIVVRVFGQDITFVVDDGILFDSCTAFDARQLGLLGSGAAGAAVIIVTDDAIIIIRCNAVAHYAETVSIVSRQFPAFYIRVPRCCLRPNENKRQANDAVELSRKTDVRLLLTQMPVWSML